MKENKLILMQKKIEQLTNVVNGLIQKLQQVDVMSKGTLTAFQLSIGEEEWKKLVEELQDVEKELNQRKRNLKMWNNEWKKVLITQAGEIPKCIKNYWWWLFN
jgi:hypothetical protein